MRYRSICGTKRSRATWRAFFAVSAPAVAIIAFSGYAEGASRRAVLAGLAGDQARVLNVGYRLARSGGDLCPAHVPGIGIMVHDAAQYRGAYRALAAGLFGVTTLPAVLAVAEGGPAARAGVAPGDAIRAIDGVAVPPGDASDGYGRVAAVLGQLDTASLAGMVTLSLSRAGMPVVARVAAEPLCPSRFQVSVDSTLNAEANGAYIEITTGLIAFTHDDDELAAVLAHEMAHNILRHRERLAAAGVPERGKLSADDEKLILATEIEADRLSVYLLDRAGYSTAAILAFWRRMASHDGFERSSPRSHPSDSERIAIISTEIDRIARLKAQGVEPSSDLGLSADLARR